MLAPRLGQSSAGWETRADAQSVAYEIGALLATFVAGRSGGGLASYRVIPVRFRWPRFPVGARSGGCVPRVLPVATVEGELSGADGADGSLRAAWPLVLSALFVGVAGAAEDS